MNLDIFSYEGYQRAIGRCEKWQEEGKWLDMEHN